MNKSALAVGSSTYLPLTYHIYRVASTPTGNDSGGECGVPVSRRFIMPQAPKPSGLAAAAAAPEYDCPPSAKCSFFSAAAAGNVSLLESDDIMGPAPADGQGKGGAGVDKAPSANAPFWYSFTYGPVAFIALSSEHDLSKDSRQYAWLEAALAAVDRCVTPWLVVLMHRPMYVVLPHKANREVAGECHSLQP